MGNLFEVLAILLAVVGVIGVGFIIGGFLSWMNSGSH